MIKQQKNNRKILIIDDDTAICELLSEYLQKHGFEVFQANSASEADNILSDDKDFAIIVLDVMMPGETGISFAKRLRDDGIDIPIIFLSAMGEVDDRIKGLQNGGNDYLVKPFDPREFLLRIKNLINAYHVNQGNKDETETLVIEFGPFVFNLESLTLFNGDNEIYLTSTEAQLLYELSLHRNNPVDRDKLCSKDGINLSPKTVDVQVNRLRRKIEDNPKEPKYIRTIRHKGYQLSVSR